MVQIVAAKNISIVICFDINERFDFIKIAEYVNNGIMLAALGKLNPAFSALLHSGTILAILGRSVATKNG